jgi:allophanate hydrolase
MPKLNEREQNSGLGDFSSAAKAYAGGMRVRHVVEAALDRINSYDDPAIWTERFSADDIFRQVEVVERRKCDGADLPLYGLTFGVKDNIDVAGHPTTAACPAFSYVARKSSPAVDRICAAGAILLGKTNLDQFASGLVGVRSPYGIPRNVIDPRYIPGGSSSGSAVAVGAGLVHFTLGTDTAGSGRVPASFNNIVGFKPSRGLLSLSGVVPACKSLDCVTAFALTCQDARTVLRAATGYDPDDVSSRRAEELPGRPAVDPGNFRFGVLSDEHLRFFGNGQARQVYFSAIERLKELGGTCVEIDFSPFAAAGQLLYQGPWVAERLEVSGELLARNPDAIIPATRKILEGASRFTAADAFSAMLKMRALCRVAVKEWAKVDVLALPTTGTIYTIEQIAADPLALNANLGYYTHFANLMDLCGVSVPAGLQADGLPTGLMLMAPAGGDDSIAAIGTRYQQHSGLKLGATELDFPPASQLKPVPAMGKSVQLVVVGAHLSGQPLNYQLTGRQARLVRAVRTAPHYRLYALAGTVPPKPGLLRVANGSGAAIEVEVWEMSVEQFGGFAAEIPPPLGIGSIELENCSLAKGFLCESHATEGARDISSFGGWRNFLASQRK